MGRTTVRMDARRAGRAEVPGECGISLLGSRYVSRLQLRAEGSQFAQEERLRAFRC